jgi:hypothetical protein
MEFNLKQEGSHSYPTLVPIRESPLARVPTDFLLKTEKTFKSEIIPPIT